MWNLYRSYLHVVSCTITVIDERRWMYFRLESFWWLRVWRKLEKYKLQSFENKDGIWAQEARSKRRLWKIEHWETSWFVLISRVWGDQTNENESHGACGIRESKEKFRRCLTGELEGKKSLTRPAHGSKDNIKYILKKEARRNLNKIDVSEDEANGRFL